MTAEQWLHERLGELRFLESYPHYASVLAHLGVVDDPRVDAMAVSCARGRFFLHVSRAYFSEAAGMLAGILLHEIHHIVLGHLTHAKFRGVAHPDALELAMEMSANEGIREPLPPHVAIADYAHVGIRAGQSTLERYELLVRAGVANKGSGRGSDKAKRMLDDHGPWLSRLATRTRDDAGAKAALALARILADGAGANGTVAGRAPGRLVEELAIVAGPRMSWRAALRAFVSRDRDRSFDYRRPNRRFPHRIGEIPGRVRRDVEVLSTLVIAIDTSASMSKRELEEIAAQLDALSALAKLVIVECDVAIQRVYPYEGRLRDVAGRGGTDLRPVFEPEVLHDLDASGVVYFTDGGGPFPKTAPFVPTLWVLTKDEPFACPWGARVSMVEAPRPR